MSLLITVCGVGALAGITPRPAAAATAPTYYLAMGDSLAAGSGASSAANRYVNRVHQAELSRFPGLVLNNISCGGATTASILNGANCGRSVTQIVDAENFLRTHKRKVAFVTIDIGGNDVSGCLTPSGLDQTCATNAAAAIQTNLTTILARLQAAYPGIKVFGMNYYIPQLGYWLTGASGQAAAQAAVPAAHTFNDQLASIYAAAGFPTADVATLFDNDNLALTGLYNGVTVPQNVANLCAWTLVCTNANIHANDTGHAKIAAAFTTAITAEMPPPSITTASLPAGNLGTGYSVTLAATGGTAPYRWKKIGKLPRGLRLKAATGVISGTPKRLVGTFSFQIQVRDKGRPKSIATRSFSITIT